jgi:hypothetical protein
MKHPQCRSAYAVVPEHVLTPELGMRSCQPSKQVYRTKNQPRRCLQPQRLLDHLEEAHFYSPKDLESIGTQLTKCRGYIDRGKDSYSPHLLTLLDARIQVCTETLARLELAHSHLTPDLTPKYDKLVSILRSLAGCNTRSKVRPRRCDISMS